LIMTKFIAGAGCFSGETLVSIPGGQKRIDQITAGDKVISFDQHGMLHEATVLKVHVHEDQLVFRYLIWGDNDLVATPNHWVLNQFNAFVAIGSLSSDDCLIDVNGHLRPITGKEKPENCTVYNLTVDGHHTFIANNICVHNAGLGAGKIIGAGGGKGSGGSSSPDVADDNLNSRAYARIIDLIGEGEIEGFPSAIAYEKGSTEYSTAMLKDIYFEKTPVLQKNANIANVADTDYNFKNVKPSDFAVRFGTQDQTYVPGFEAAESETSVNVIVKKGSPITRTITNSEVDRVRITLRWEALQKIQNDGDITGLTVEYQIAFSYNGGAFQEVVSSSVKGRTGDPFEKSHVIPINGAFPVAIRVYRETKNFADNPQVVSQFSWASYTEIIDAKLRYPNSALIAIQIDSKNFSSIPTRSYRVRGIKVKIPTNATVDQTNGRLIYSGIWDGTFSPAVWTSDPLWTLWDLLTNCRYGLGQHIKPRDLDKWSFYEASKYANELVETGLFNSSGQAIMEPRFSCNVVIQSQEEAYKVINDLCSVFRAMPYWGAGTLMLSQDRPTSPTIVFNQSNVTEEGFQYNGSSLKSRHTVAIVKYFDMENQEYNYESVEDPVGISRYGVLTTEIEAFACTSRSQAHRVGEWLLYSEQNETDVLTFKTSIDMAIEVRPGTVISVSDPLRAGTRRGGRIKAAGTNYITIDSGDSTDMPVSGTPQIYVSMIDGTAELKDVSSVSGSRINISGGFDSTPIIGGTFIYSNIDMPASLWRVLSVEESDQTEYTITAISYNESKYDYIERGASLERKVLLPLDVSLPGDPKNLLTNVATTTSDGSLSNKLLISWETDANAVQYQVRYRLVG
jgi:predicted phage tail protein